MILPASKYSEVQEMNSQDDDDLCDDKTEKYPILMEDGVQRMVEQLKKFAADKGLSMLNGLINCKSIFCSNLRTKERT